MVAVMIMCVCGMPLPVAAQEQSPEQAQPVSAPAKILVLITEQNIGGPQRAWWASEIDLSVIAASLAQALVDSGYQVIDPESARPLLQKEPAYRLVRMKECDMSDFANLEGATYVIKGSAIASQGTAVPQSGMRSYYARVSARLIRVKDRAAVAAMNVWGKSVHTDAVAGGSEALEDAGKLLAKKLLTALQREGAGR
jgi:TolB-like protein